MTDRLQERLGHLGYSNFFAHLGSVEEASESLEATLRRTTGGNDSVVHGLAAARILLNTYIVERDRLENPYLYNDKGELIDV